MSSKNIIIKENNQGESANPNDKKNEIYFIILVPSQEKIDFKKGKFKSDIIIEIIHRKNIQKEYESYEEIVFKLKKNNNKSKRASSNNYIIQYIEEDYEYVISFSVKENIFIYETELEKGNKYIENINKEKIYQSIAPYYNKLNIFIEALQENNEINKISKLYEDTIALYEKKKKFCLLISLFLKVYDHQKDLCKKLLDIFYSINEQENTDRNKDLQSNLSSFKQIYENASDIIQKNGYDVIKFYGVLFSYFNYYDKNNFSQMIKKFSEGNADILYEILIMHYSNFINPLNQDKEFYNDFIRYAIQKDKELKIFKRILNYIDDIEAFLYVINEKKEYIFKKYDELKLDPIKLTSELKLTKKKVNKEKEETINYETTQPETDEKNNKGEEESELNVIIKLIESIINFSSYNQILLVYIESTFWIYLLKQYNIPDWENINNCFKLRELFKKYKNLINDLYKEEAKNSESIKKKKDIISIIINDVNRYYERDEFAFILNKNIKDFFEINKEKITDLEKLDTFVKFNPYFNADNEKYKNSRETYIFDYINFGKTTEEFNEAFHRLNFEAIFQENMTEFIYKITSKIKDIPTFGNIIKLIDVTRIHEKKKDYYNILKNKYEYIIKYDIQFLKGDKSDKAIKIVCEFISKIFLDENNTSFLEERISKLDEKIKFLIYSELIKAYNDKKYEKMKNYIYDIFLKKLDDIDNILKLIGILSEDDKSFFLDKLMERCEFTKEEFYSNSENKKIKLLCYLNELERLNILGQDNKYVGKLKNILDDIRKELENGLISKKLIETFLNIKKEENEEKKIIQKLGLIRMVLKEYEPIKKYFEYKKNINEINEKFNRLNFIKDSLVIFHKNKYIKVIQEIENIINIIETKPITEFRTEEMRNKIFSLLKYESLCNEIKIVKDFLLFKKIFGNTQGKDGSDRFENGIRKLHNLKRLFEYTSNIEIIFNEKYFVNIFRNIKEELARKDESKSDEFIKQMVEYFNIKDEKKIEELAIIIKSKKYEMVVKSIKFFFDNFSGKKLNLPRNIELSEMNLKDLKRTLKYLKDDNIFDYQSNNPFYRVFISFYEKKEAIDFLITNTDKFIYTIKDKLDPSNKSISFKDIEDTIECLCHFTNFIFLDDSSKIMDCLKELDEETIKKFENYSKKYPLIIELDRKNEKDAFEKVYQIIQDANLIFKLDNEDFYYKIDGQNNPVNIKELIDLKNKINVQNENKKINKYEDEKKDIYQIKCDKLMFFKKIIFDLEVLYNMIKILRIKGYNIPILIIIVIRYPEITYKFNNEEKDFNYIKNYLFNIRNKFENQLDKIYQNEKHLRFLYGKLFRKIELHQEGNCKVLEIIRYILNEVDYRYKIKDGEIYYMKISRYYESECKYHTKKIFENLSKYIISLFKKNNLSYQKHYENMLIKGEKKYKGFYIFKCENLSMEEYILYLFQEKLEEIPIAQNILICSSETLTEEMQSFFYRAVLCDYNTLFVIQLLESFSNFQYKKMYSYIDKILTYKLENSEMETKGINKSNTREYLNSCIFFVYKNLKNESSFLNELRKYGIQKQDIVEYFYKDNKKDNKKENMIGDFNISNLLNVSNNQRNDKLNIQDKSLFRNIKVFSSDVCGLGKSFKIKKLIKENNEIYYHFPLGGMLTKTTIYEKLFKLLKRIKKDLKIKKEEEENLPYNNVSIHLDIIESEETSLINEFLFSFLVSKFYATNGNIIYIPNNIKIYIEIPNSFENYLIKFGILNVFEINNIALESLHKLELEEYIKQIFNKMIGKSTNEEIEEFIKENIGIKEYSYHQIKTFIKIFISQFKIFDGKLKIINSQGNKISYKFIEDIIKSSKYFTNREFQKLIMDKKQYIKDKIDLCLDPYVNDLNKVKFKIPLIFVDIKTMIYNIEMFSDNIHELETANQVINPSYEYLKRLKQILYLKNDLEKDEGNRKSLLSILDSDNTNYVITDDTYKKMLLLIYIIKADVPVIIMGETGCGKTSLIIKLNQILNNGEKLLETINIHPSITDEEICKRMKEINEIAKRQEYLIKEKNIKKELWVFFDEINTCLSFSHLMEKN